jgi:hypothetical protein
MTQDRRRAPWRWAIALVATLALVVSGSGLVVFAQSGAAESRGPAFVPAGTPMYLELRLDMPAGQDEALAQMLTAFPGFADPSSFDMKVDEAFAGLVSGMGIDVSMDELFGEVLTGEVGIAIVDFEEAMMNNSDPGLLVGMAVADPAKAQSLLDTLTADATTTEEVYSGATLITDPTTAATVYGDWVVLGNGAELVKASVDVLDGTAPSLADDTDFAAAAARVPTAHLAAGYVDLAAFAPLVDLAGMAAAGQTGVALPTDDLEGLLPSSMVAWVFAEPDRVTLEAVVTPGEEPMPTAVGESDLATLFPADTQVYLEAREFGSAVETGLNGLAELMEQQAEMAPPEDDMGDMGGLGGFSDIEILFSEESPFSDILGAPLPQVLDFVEDLGVGVGLDSDGLWLGIAGEVSDETIAEDRVGNIVSLLRLLGGTNPQETGISVGSEMVAGVEVTTITLPLDDATGGAGLPVQLGDTISVAVADGKLLMGLGDFVQSALSSDGSDSLATSAGYVDALGDDTINAGLMYMNAADLVVAMDPVFEMAVADWAEIEPFASGADRIIIVSTADDEVSGARMTKIVNQ